MQELVQSIRRNSLVLGLFAIITVGLVAATYVLTAPRIDASVRKYEQKALLAILPDSKHDNDLLKTRISVGPDQELLGLDKPASAYVGFKKGKPVAVILPVVAPDGYSGRIHLLVGIYADGTISGVRTTQHKETPGLGDKIDIKVSNWILSFTGHSLTNPGAQGWGVKKDGGQFDQFTGATITPRAVVKAVHKALEYFSQHRSELFKQGQQVVEAEHHDA